MECMMLVAALLLPAATHPAKTQQDDAAARDASDAALPSTADAETE